MARTTSTETAESVAMPSDVRQRILDTASALFYERGVRAVGVDLVVDESGVAKTSLYRHFRTKDDLIVAFLEREDAEFWAQWDDVAACHAGDPAAEIEAHMRWIGKRLARANYRGCPQINVAAEFAEAGHPAREVSRRHMQAMRKRLAELARRFGAARPNDLAAQLGVLVNGAFVSASMLAPDEATRVLLASARALLASASK
ncbi:TetR/AcrR family transcriptional regulator [Scleromatobacter humisilvae]|uniref:TetR/AcrR family transcriptional regulator n=1 Tax=Scleromatobacter humisilvae TaxID=2897159 RepID=A0A9X2C0S0_9BURK|nr:TetR/AcrR family transcriptional regulator [Scleromatobacter humisilvae]MCK9685039.1 TetR/AcrR family transcriptional regulator [Scleromatobacter humisilvae]